MRDRLSNLQQVQIDSEGFSTVELDDLSGYAGAAAAGAEGAEGGEEGAAGAEGAEGAAGGAPDDQDMNAILQDAQQIRQEIQQIQNDISELKDVNYQTLNKTSFDDAIKRDSNAIGADIKHRAEAVLQQLHHMNAVRGELEAQRGSSDPTARIARTQYQCLSNALQEVMFSYNNTEMNHREACKRQIQRQMEVVGKQVSEEELEEMMEGEELTVFSVQLQGKTAQSALLQIESRHRELVELEKRIASIQELFLDVAVLIEEQGVAVENIQRNVQNAGQAVQVGVSKLERAAASDKSNPFKRMFCGCFPCFYS